VGSREIIFVTFQNSRNTKYGETAALFQRKPAPFALPNPTSQWISGK